MREIEALFAREEEFGDLDAAGAVERLSRAIQYPTINWADHSRTDFAPFEGLLAHIRASYPTLMERGKLERIDRGVLITIPGRDPALRPCLYMSHQDVVPVVEGTEGDWTHPPFSGAVADGYIWGRGALDIKQQVFGLLEAAEYLLRRGAAFARTAYLAFGDDEETLNLGARAIARELERRGVTLEFVLDEGSGKVEPGDALGGARDPDHPNRPDGEGIRGSGAVGPERRWALQLSLWRHLPGQTGPGHRADRGPAAPPGADTGGGGDVPRRCTLCDPGAAEDSGGGSGGEPGGDRPAVRRGAADVPLGHHHRGSHGDPGEQ